MNTLPGSPAPACRSKLDSLLRILSVAVGLGIVAITTPLALADHMGNHERGPSASDCTTAAGESHPGPSEDSSDDGNQPDDLTFTPRLGWPH